MDGVTRFSKNLYMVKGAGSRLQMVLLIVSINCWCKLEFSDALGWYIQ